MTFYNKKTAENWTEKHEQYCLENRVSPCAKLLWQWLIRQGKLGNEIETDLAEFNNWIKKHRGKGYCRLTLKNAFELLIQLRVVNLVKRFTWRLVRIVTRPLEWFMPKKNLRSDKQIYVLPPSNPQNSEACNQQQQQSFLIQENASVLATAGINFTESNKEVLDRPTSEIKLAVIMFELKGGFEKILNPEGWIRTCLRNRIWEEPRNYQILLSKLGNLTMWNELFPDSLISCY